MKELKRSFLLLMILTLITGILYPLGITSLAKIFFSHQAQGSLIVQNGKIIGSELIGQNFDDPRYLWGRPSATAPAYNAAASSGSNLGPSNPALLGNIKSRIEQLKKFDNNPGPIPIDLVTSSASGLDPDISPSAADYQVTRISKISQLPENDIRKIIQENTVGRTFGLLGEPRVNVLSVNLALKKIYDR